MAVIKPDVPASASIFGHFLRLFQPVPERGVTRMIKPALKADSDFWMYQVGVRNKRGK